VAASTTARREDATVPVSYFLAASPHVPLAVVRGREITEAVPSAVRGKSCGKKSRWATRGSSWLALDAWGQSLGKATVEEIEDYDVTGCAEVYFAPKFDRGTGGMLFVSGDSAWKPAASLKWAPPPQPWGKLQNLIESTFAGVPKRKLPDPCTEPKEATRFFKFHGASGDERKLAVSGRDGGYVIARWENGGWTSEHVQRTPAKKPMCFRPVSVFDMNGDGEPEITLRFAEGEGETWGDFVLSRSANATWSLVADSPGGSTR
jgi:hypothetical protein